MSSTLRPYLLSAHCNGEMTPMSFAVARRSACRQSGGPMPRTNRHSSPTNHRTGVQAMVSRMAVMSSSLVSGLTIAKRARVSPSCVVGTTNANSSASIRSDHFW